MKARLPAPLFCLLDGSTTMRFPVRCAHGWFALCLCPLIAPPAWAQYRPGDKIVVIADATLTVGTTAGDEVWPGLVLQVGDVNGKRLWFSNGKPGWLDQRHVVPLDRAAIDHLSAMIRANPGEDHLYSGRADVWGALGETDSAIDDLNEAIRLSPSAAYYSNRGIAWRDNGEYDRAMADYNEALRLDPKYVPAYINRSLAWHDRGENDRAIVDLNEALRLDPKDAAAYNNRGNAWLEMGEYDRAITDYNEALSLAPKFADAHKNRGIAWKNKGENDRAIADYNEALLLDPKCASAYYNRGNAWSNKGDYDRAMADYSEALRLSPKHQYYPIFGHLSARQAGDEPASTRFLEACGPADGPWPAPAVRYLRGELDEEALLALANDDDKRTEARCYFGVVHAVAGRTRQALVHFQWVRDHGNKGYVEYGIALAELRRLEAAAKSR